MYPASFDYYRPKNLKEALALLRKNKDAKLLAGGHSLLPAMKLRVSSPTALIDIARNQKKETLRQGEDTPACLMELGRTADAALELKFCKTVIG